MPVDSQTITNFGRDLRDQYESEVARRSIVRLLYYGLFHQIRIGFSGSERRRSHEQVQTELLRQTRSEFANIFRELRELREEADYNLVTASWDRKHVRAERLVEKINRELKRRFPSKF